MIIFNLLLIVFFITTNIKLFKLKENNENLYIYEHLEYTSYSLSKQTKIYNTLMFFFIFFSIYSLFTNTYENIWDLVIAVLNVVIFVTIFSTSLDELLNIILTKKVIKQINNEILSIAEHTNKIIENNIYNKQTNIKIYHSKETNSYVKYFSYKQALNDKTNIIGYIVFIPKTLYQIEHYSEYTFTEKIINKISKEDNIANIINYSEDNQSYAKFYIDFYENARMTENFIVYENTAFIDNENKIIDMQEITISNPQKRQLKQILETIEDEDVERIVELIEEYKDTQEDNLLEEINYLINDFITDETLKNDLINYLELENEFSATNKDLKLSKNI